MDKTDHYSAEQSAADDTLLELLAHPGFAVLQHDLETQRDQVAQIILGGVQSDAYFLNLGAMRALAMLADWRAAKRREIEERRSPPNEA